MTLVLVATVIEMLAVGKLTTTPPGVGVGVWVGTGVEVGVAVGPAPVIVISPLFWLGVTVLS